MNFIDRAKQIIGIERDALSDLAESINGNFDDAVNIILETKGRIVVTGMGKSGLIGKKISSTLSSVGTRSFFIHPAEAIHGDIGMMDREDTILAISNSGETEEIVRLLPMAKRFGLKMISMTGRPDSTLGKAADVCIYSGAKTEACPWDVVPTSSTTVTLALGDALALVVMEKKGFNRDDFANYHPGGNLGRGLLLTVEDIVHTGGRIPIVEESSTMKEILKEVTVKKLGVTLVCDSEGKLTGIITDGDIRRIFEMVENPMNKKAKDVMGRKPRTIGKTAVGAEAVKIMNDMKITSLAIVSEDGKPEGIIHMHDLLKAGVA
ncbi:MAG: KpsF/GutQ family sugar-phosphate isomerase [Nitrospinota bacterium]